MKRLSASFILALFLVAAPAQAALSAAIAWEIRPTVGSNNNGGGFVAGATGTDFSQQDAAQYTFTNLASSNGTTSPCIVTSASHNFVAADVGNILHVTAGTNWTASWFQIVSVAANAATLDRACGSAASLTNGTFFVGGALASITTALATVPHVGSNKFFVKASGTFTTSGLTLNTAVTPSSTVPPNQLIGYTTTRTDAGRATIQITGGTTVISAGTVTGWYIRNLVLDCNSRATSTGIQLSDFSRLENSEVKNCTTEGVNLTAASPAVTSMTDTEIHGGTSCTDAFSSTGPAQILRNWIHNNACPGMIVSGGQQAIVFNLITNNTGASSDGIRLAVSGSGNGVSTILNNTIYANGRDGINLSATNDLIASDDVRNNILVNNGRYGINGAAAAGSAAFPQYDGNAYFNNTTAARNNMDDTTTNVINGVAPYTNPLDVTMTCDPFVNAAGNDYRLNNTAGCGASIRYAGTPGPFTGNSFSGAMGIGASQVGAQTRASASAQ